MAYSTYRLFMAFMYFPILCVNNTVSTALPCNPSIKSLSDSLLGSTPDSSSE